MSDVSYRSFTGTGAENYQRHFVPAIATPVSAGLVAAADLQPGQRVLDVACGTGVIARLTAQRVGPTGTVTAIDLASGRRETFARNRGEGPPRPASALDLELAFERPVDVKFGPDGLVYVLDFGVFNPTEEAARVLPKTGRIFRIEPVPAAGAGGG